MSSWKEGDRVKVVSRPVTDDDRKTNRYFEHMAGLVGTIQNVYSETEIAIKVDNECLNKITASVQKESTIRMREKFLANATEEQKKQLSKEELDFDVHYMQLVMAKDLEKA